MLDKKVTDNRKKNTKRKITKEVKAIVWKREKWKCIIYLNRIYGKIQS